MAKIDIKMPEEFLLRVSKLAEKTDEIIPKVLKAGGTVVLPKVKSNLQAVIGSNTKYKSRPTGELVEALGVTSAKQDRDGNFNVKIGFTEPREDGESNAKVANILEYGKSGQPAKPFLKPAKSASKKTVCCSHDRFFRKGAGQSMSVLSELNTVLVAVGIPIETGVFSGVPPDEYIVITPMNDTFEGYADNQPQQEIQEVRLSLFVKGSYTARKNQIVKVLLMADFTITDRRYIWHEDDTGFHHYTIDVAKEYETED